MLELIGVEGGVVFDPPHQLQFLGFPYATPASCLGVVLTIACATIDRPLQHINKKGRPVSQCQHCRAMRKSRSAHVKCECGEKTHKCIHLRPVVEGHKGEHCRV